MISIQRTDIGKFYTNSFHRITQATGPDYPFPFDDPPIEPVQGFLEDGSTRLFSVQAKPKNDGVAVPTGSFFGEAWAEKRPGAASEEILDMLSTITPGPQAITYTSYHQPASLSETIDGTSYLLEYTYDADQQRNYSKLRNMTAQSTVEERWYEHGLETQRLNGNPSTDRKILYVQGGDGLCAMIVAEPGGTQTAYAVYRPDPVTGLVARVEIAKAARLSLRRNSLSYCDERKASKAFAATAISGRSREAVAGSGRGDHLGSIVAVTRHTFSPELLGGGNSGIPEIMAEQNFDAWGRRRNPNTWTYTSLPVLPSWLYRGYTGHEHIEPFALINMNGRLYDPLNGRMLSADNYVQDGLGTQGYNRYSYAGNNPMKYTDPDGENPLLIAAIIGGTMNWLAHGAEFSMDGLGYFGVGAAAGLVGAGVGAGVSSALAGGGFWAGAAGTSGASAVGFGSGALAGAAGGGAGGFLLGSGNSAVAGSSANDILNAGLRDGAYGALSGGLLGGIQGGIAANRQGANFWTGKEGQVGRGRLSFTPNKERLGPNGESLYKQYWATDDGAVRADFNYAADVRIQDRIRNKVGLNIWNDPPQSRMITAVGRAKGSVQLTYRGYVPDGETLTISRNGNVLVELGAGHHSISRISTFNPRSISISLSGIPSRVTTIPLGPIVNPSFHTNILMFVP